MKKLLLILVLVSGWLWAQNSLTLFKYIDDQNFEKALLMPDGETPVPDGCLVEVCLPVDPENISFESDPSGEQLFNYRNRFVFNGENLIGKPGFFYCEFYYIWIDGRYNSDEPAAHCEDHIYLRIYDATEPEKARFFRHSQLIKGPPAGLLPSEIEVSDWGDWQKIDN